MTSVLGHITQVEFPPEYKDWKHPPPNRLFDAPVKTVFSEVWVLVDLFPARRLK